MESQQAQTAYPPQEGGQERGSNLASEGQLTEPEGMANSRQLKAATRTVCSATVAPQWHRLAGKVVSFPFSGGFPSQ